MEWILFGALSPFFVCVCLLFLCVCVCVCVFATFFLFLSFFFCQTVVECVDWFFFGFGNWDFIFITRDNQLDLPILIRSFLLK